MFPSQTGTVAQRAVYILFDDLGGPPISTALGGCAYYGGQECWGWPGSTSYPEGSNLRQQLLRFLASAVELGRQYEVVVPGVGVVHRATTSLPVLAAALQRVDEQTHLLHGKFSAANPAPDVALVNEETARLLAFARGAIWVGDDPHNVRHEHDVNAVESLRAGSLEQIAGALRNVPGRKPLSWLTRATNELDARRAEMFTGAAVSVYPAVLTRPVDVRGDTHQALFYRSQVKATGGEMVPYRNGPMSAVKAALDNCGPYYLISLQSDSPQAWKSVTISVNKHADFHVSVGK